jgi:membrane associated rhomboid family serine protease
MFPLGDDNSGRRTMPVVTVVLIALNVLVFFLELNGGEKFIREWAFIPARFGANPSGDKFLIFYLVCGIAATFAQFAFTPNSSIPNVGASGAIAGVLGAYLLLFPSARVRVLVANQVVALPALVVLGMWIALQVFSGVGSIETTAQTEDAGGVAYMAHVGGFAAGFLLCLLLRGRGASSTSA